MSATINENGKEYSRLVVINRAGTDRFGRALWLCRCLCGQNSLVAGADLRSGDIKSCGCLRREFANGYTSNRKHGMGRTPEYAAWSSAIYRCQNPKNKSYQNYGGRGIDVCERWLGDKGFENFYSDLGPRPSSQHSLDRIDSDGDYCPENCRWADREIQFHNRRVHLLLAGILTEDLKREILRRKRVSKSDSTED